MVRDIAETVVGIFETSNRYRFEDVLKLVKKQYHISASELKKVKREAEILLTYDLLEPERSVDVC